ncbi:hypothetical protein BGW42_006063 [Actinomortierella wolfii]|nr:hypothetical protein BGW42_006063 [Actinomortierella wolfii]
MSETTGTTSFTSALSISGSPTLEVISTLSAKPEPSPTMDGPPLNKGGGLQDSSKLLCIVIPIAFAFCAYAIFTLFTRRSRHQHRSRSHHRHDHQAKSMCDHEHPPSYKAAVPMAVGAAAGMTAVAVATANDGHPAEEKALDEDETAYGTSNGATVSNVTEAMDVTTSTAYAGAATDVFGMAGTAPANSATPMPTAVPIPPDNESVMIAVIKREEMTYMFFIFHTIDDVLGNEAVDSTWV